MIRSYKFDFYYRSINRSKFLYSVGPCQKWCSGRCSNQIRAWKHIQDSLKMLWEVKCTPSFHASVVFREPSGWLSCRRDCHLTYSSEEAVPANQGSRGNTIVILHLMSGTRRVRTRRAIGGIAQNILKSRKLSTSTAGHSRNFNYVCENIKTLQLNAFPFLYCHLCPFSICV